MSSSSRGGILATGSGTVTDRDLVVAESTLARRSKLSPLPLFLCKVAKLILSASDFFRFYFDRTTINRLFCPR